MKAGSQKCSSSFTCTEKQNRDSDNSVFNTLCKDTLLISKNRQASGVNIHGVIHTRQSDTCATRTYSCSHLFRDLNELWVQGCSVCETPSACHWNAGRVSERNVWRPLRPVGYVYLCTHTPPPNASRQSVYYSLCSISAQKPFGAGIHTAQMKVTF